MEKSRRLGRGVAAGTYDAMVAGKAIIETIGAVVGLLFAAIERV